MSHRQSWLGWLVQPEVLGEPLGDAIGTARAGSRSNSQENGLFQVRSFSRCLSDTQRYALCPLDFNRRAC